MPLKRGLGSNLNNLGLGELLSNINSSNDTVIANNHHFKKVPIEVLGPGKYQPRGKMDDESLQELAASIRAQGIIQPIVVRSKSKSNAETMAAGESGSNHTEEYEIIAGERRWRAAQIAGMDKVPVIIRDLNDEQASAIALIENMQREDLNVIDAALGLKRLVDEFGLTHQDAAKVISKSRASVTNLLRLLELNDEVKNMVRRGELEMGHARALLTLTLPKQMQLAKMIIARNLSVRATESLVGAIHKPKAIMAKTDKRDPNILQLQNQLKRKLNAKVDIRHQASGRGRLVVHYFSLDELEGILSKIDLP